MKIRTLFLVFTVGFFSSCSTDEQTKDSETPETSEVKTNEENSYKNFIKSQKIKTKTAFLQEFKFGEPADTKYKVYHCNYDQNGNLLDSIVYNANIEVFHEQYVYNSDNEMISRSILDSTGNILQVSERKMDEGKEKEFSIKNGDSLYYKQISAYDTAGNRIKVTEYDSQGKPQIFSEFTYNEKGKMLSKTEKNKDGNILTKIVYTYDKDGNKASITTYNSTGGVEGKTFLKNYTELGKAKLVEKYDANDSLFAKYKYTYDENGNETQNIIYNGIDQIIRQSDAEYNKFGKRTKFSIYEGEVGFLGRDVIKYDENGNEIEFIMLDKDEKQVKRKQTFYNDKGIVEKEVNYNKIDEPIYQFSYTYSYFE